MSHKTSGSDLGYTSALPAGWGAGDLGDYWDVLDCKHITAKFEPEGFPVVSLRDVQKRFVDLANAKRTAAVYYKLLIEGGRNPLPGDLILSRNATVGEVAQVGEWQPPFAMGQDVCLLRRRTANFSAGFMQALFQSRIIAVQIADLMVGSTFKRINVKQIRDLQVPMPPPAEQHAIAEALSDADAAIEALDALIAKKRDVKQAAMQQLLTGRTRLPGFSGEWRESRLGDLGRCLRGVSYDPRNDLSASDSVTTVRLLRSNNVQHSLLGFDDVQFVSEARVSDEQILRPGDIVVCMANGSKALVGKSGVFRRVETQRYTFGGSTR